MTLDELVAGMRQVGADDRADELDDVAEWLREEAPVEGLSWSPLMVRAIPPSVAARRVKLMILLAGAARRADDGEEAVGFEDLALWFADRAPLCRVACQRGGTEIALSA